jgi:hypothetical protein
MNILPERAVQRLEKILSQLECESNGVRLASVAAATRVLQEHGFRWCQILNLSHPLTTSQQERPAHHASPERRSRHDWRDALAACWRRPDLLSEWEKRFIGSLSQQAILSQKQWAILHKLATRARWDGGE